MAVLSVGALTLADWAKRQDPDGKTASVAELLSQTNEILEDAVFKEANQATGHRVTIRTGLPAAYWRAINAGVPTSKSTTAQVDESVGILEARSDIDIDQASLNGNTAEYRLSEDSPFIESMNITQAQTMFYGNVAVDPKSYTGLATRYGNISGAPNAQNIIDAGGVASNNTSIWLVVWGENTTFCTFPKGSQAGLLHDDLGITDALDQNGNKFRAYSSRYQWKNGLVVKDWRYVVRIANINVANLVSESGAADLVKLLSRVIDRVPNLNMGRPVFYMNRTVRSILRVQAMNKTANFLGIEKGLNQFGAPASTLSFQGIPLRLVDQLLNTEARVV